MIESPTIEYFRNKGLLPFQAEFAVKFLTNTEKRFWQLASPVGTGKTRLAGAIIAHELERATEKRFLVLSPSSLLTQWQSEVSEMISSTRQDVAPLVIDRKTYLQLESRVPVGQNPWPSLIVALMSIDVAKREDMTKNLVGANWDLAIIDESHLLTGQRRKLFDRLVNSHSIARGLLLTATPLLTLHTVATETINWHNIIDWDGHHLYPSFKRTAVILDFERTAEEKGILNDLVGFARELARLKPYGTFQSWILLRAAASSMFALEESLRRLQVSWRSMRNKIAHGIPWTKEDLEKGQQEIALGLDDVEISEDISNAIITPGKKFLDLYQKLEGLVDRLDEIQIDSKLNGLVSYLKGSYVAKVSPYLCIWTSFRSTAEYLMSSLEDLRIPLYLLTGSLNIDERKMQLDSFRSGGGILISTDAMLEGVALPYVDEALNYDVPVNPLKLEQRWGRFLRIGRKTNLKMVFMRDKSGSLTWEEDLLRKMERKIKFEKAGKGDVLK